MGNWELGMDAGTRGRGDAGTRRKLLPHLPHPPHPPHPPHLPYTPNASAFASTSTYGFSAPWAKYSAS
ncbi:MAG: hypothetical protein KME21_10295 [Desmonostoc vinosum HA7617-LM4]|jgi:hypothetical protein|nr:hypothetical protein [Desmonostoc vinosum HA7617-LM4]